MICFVCLKVSILFSRLLFGGAEFSVGTYFLSVLLRCHLLSLPFFSVEYLAVGLILRSFEMNVYFLSSYLQCFLFSFGFKLFH